MLLKYFQHYMMQLNLDRQWYPASFKEGISIHYGKRKLYVM